MATLNHTPNQGLVVKTADPLQDPNSYQRLRNADLFAEGAIKKRRGYVRTSDTDLDGDPLPGELEGVGYRDEELLRVQNRDLYGYVPDADRWVRKGAWDIAVSSEEILLTRPRSIFSGDYAELDGYRVFAWLETPVVGGASTTDILWGVHTTEGAEVARPATLDTAASGLNQPRTVAMRNWIAVTWYNANTRELSIARWQPDLPAVLSAPVVAITDMGYSFEAVDDELWVVRPGATIVGGQAALDIYRPDLSLRATNPLPGMTTTRNGTAIDYIPSTGEFVTAWDQDPANTRYAWYDNAAIPNLITLGTIAGGSIHVTVTVDDPNETAAVVLDRQVGPTPHETRLLKYTVRRNVALATLDWDKGALQLVTTAFAPQGLGTDAYVLAIYPDDSPLTPLCSTYFEIRVRDGAVTGRAFPFGQASTYHQRFAIDELTLTRPTQPTLNGALLTQITYPVGVRTRFAASTMGDPDDYSAEVMGRVVMDYGQARNRSMMYSGIAVWPTAGYLRGYDGQYTFEVDYHTKPVIIEITNIPSGGPIIASGDYVWAVTYAWRDLQGRLYRSLVGTFEHTVDPGTVPELEIRTLRVTDREDVIIEVWRTQQGPGTTFTLVSDPEEPLQNDPTVNSVSFEDDNSDGMIANNELLDLFPAGAELPNDMVQVTAWAALAGDRLWCRASDSPARCRASKLPQDGHGPELSLVPFVDLDTQQAAQGLGYQDGVYFGVSEENISTWSGRGIENNGAGTIFTEPQAIPTSEGSPLVASVVRSAIGLVYATSDGPAVIGRDQSSQTPFASITELYRYGTQVVSDILYDARQGELWVYDAGNITTEPDRGTLSWSAETNRWSQHNSLQAIESALSADGALALARTDGALLLRDLTRVLTAVEATHLDLTTAWQHPSGNLLAPYTLEAITLVMNFRGTHKLTAELYANYDLTMPRATVTIDPERNDLRVIPGWGTDVSAWGDGYYWGGGAPSAPGRRYLVHIQTKGMPIAAAAIRLYDSPGDTETYELIQMSTEWISVAARDSVLELDHRQRYPMSKV